MEKKAGLVSKQTAAGFSANCYLVHDFLFLWKKKISAWTDVPKPAFPLVQTECFICNFI